MDTNKIRHDIRNSTLKLEGILDLLFTDDNGGYSKDDLFIVAENEIKSLNDNFKELKEELGS